MFGSRNSYLSHFELTIPATLYLDWHRCFVFHKLALEAIKAGRGSPVWMGDNRIAPVSSSSIDQSTVDLNRGEMNFPIIKINPQAIDEIAGKDTSAYEKLEALHQLLGPEAFPEYLLRYIQSVRPAADASVAVLRSSSIANYKDGDDIDKARIERSRGFFGTNQMERPRFPLAVHFLKVFYNADLNGRLFYKFDGSIQFIKNRA